MARSKRRAMPRRTRRRADWVYRPNAVDAAGASDTLGTYRANVSSISSGVVNAQGLMLYDSRNHMRDLTGISTAQATRVLRSAARSEGPKPYILRVQGTLYLEPSAWALGNVWAIGIRILVADQDDPQGLVTIDDTYSMWDNPADPTSLASFANSRDNVWETRIWRAFNSSESSIKTPHFNIPVRRRLQAQQCLCLYLEVAPTSVNMRYIPWFRTLVVDEE